MLTSRRLALCRVVCGLLLLSLACLLPAAGSLAGRQPARAHGPKEVLIYDYPPGKALPIRFRLADGGPKGDPQRAALRLSGSSQFDADGLDNLVRFLPGPLTVVDLRQESHGFLNGRPVSWFAPKDFGNRGKTPEAVARDEQRRLAALARAGTAELAVILEKSQQGAIASSETFAVDVTSVESEAQLTAGRGLGYLRLPVTDHSPPEAAQVDRFVKFCRTLPSDAWLHLHCHAGEGRTTTFMVVYALLRNSGGKSLETIAAEQLAAGGVDLLGSPPEKGWKRPLYLARAEFLRQFAAYAAANPGGAPQTFSQWRAAGNR